MYSRVDEGGVYSYTDTVYPSYTKYLFSGEQHKHWTKELEQIT